MLGCSRSSVSDLPETYVMLLGKRHIKLRVHETVTRTHISPLETKFLPTGGGDFYFFKALSVPPSFVESKHTFTIYFERVLSW